MTSKSRSVPLVVSLLLVASVAIAEGPATTTETTSLEIEDISAEVLAAMDPTADPCRDFQRYACGGWLDATELPADQPIWNRSFSVIIERNREVLRDIIEDAAAHPGDDPTRRRVGAYYQACMDEAAVEEAGHAPLQPLLGRIDDVSDAESLMAVVGELHRKGVGTLFGAGVFEDFGNPDLNVVHFVQGGLGLPDRDYYVSEDPKKQQLLARYEEHVARMFELLGDDPGTAAGHAAQVLAFETSLAEASRDSTEMRNLETQAHRMNLDGLVALTPELPWKSYFAAIGYPEVDDINVRTPEFFEAVERLVDASDPAVLQTYLRWHLINDAANLLPSAFVAADFEFYGRALAGQQEIKPRWKRCVSATQNALGEAVGKLYVDRMFPGDSKAIALEMIHDIEAAFGANLERVDWMDDTTRGRAQEKLAALRDKIGYPDRWRDYSTIALTRTSYFGNAITASEFDFDFAARKIGRPVDKSEWAMSPQVVNAYHNPLGNEIVFPAGILQPPMFHRDFPAAMNYGAIGGAIGHELTHGYDDQGRKFDPHGRLQEWWAPEVSARYESRAQCIADYYQDFEVEPGLNVNGKLTLGENIADIGGLKLAYRAYKLWEKHHGTPEPLAEGLTNDQLVFLAWAQAWCTIESPEYLRLQVTSDPHTPARFRILGPMSQIPAFAEAFGCQPGTPMSPDERCSVW